MDIHTISTEITSHTPYSHNHKQLKGISRQSTSFQSTWFLFNSNWSNIPLNPCLTRHKLGTNTRLECFLCYLNTVNSTNSLPNPFNSSRLPNPQTIKMTAFLPSLSRFCTVFDGFSQLKNRHFSRWGQQFDGFFQDYCQNSSIIFDLGTNQWLHLSQYLLM